MNFLIAFIFPVISYFLQVLPRFFNRYYGVDVWTLLTEADLLRKNKHRIPKGEVSKGFIFKGYFDYPPVFLIFLSFFPKSLLFEIQGFINPFFDAIQNLLTFFIAMQLTGDLRVALLAQAIYTFTPVIPLENAALSPRSFGYLCFTIAFYFLLLYNNSSNPRLEYLLISLIFSTIIFLSHKFATQSLLFISLIFSFLEKTPLYILSFFIAMVAAIIVSKGYYIQVLKSHINIIYFWFNNYKYRYAHQIYGITAKKKNDLTTFLFGLLAKFAPVALFGSNIWILSGFIFLLLSVSTSVILYKMALWIISFYVIAALVSTIKRLTPIGEGYRYLEMNPVPSAILSSFIFFYLYDNSSFRTPVLIFYGFFFLMNFSMIVYLQIKGIIKDKNRSVTKSMNDMFNYINKLPAVPRIMCIPHQITTMTVYNTKADVLVNFDTTAFMKMQDFFPVLKKSVQSIIDKYKINYLILREGFASLKDLKLKNYKIVYKSEDALLIKVK